MTYERARRAVTTHTYDYVGSYVNDLGTVVDLDIIRSAKLKIGVDPLGGASIGFWHSIVERYGVEVEVVNDVVDPTFRFMPLDWDGKIRMDCSSPYAMARLIELKDRFDIAFGNDADADRHGIVTHAGLMEPNQYLATAISYLFTHRPAWRPDPAVGKTLVSSSMIDRVAAKVGRPLVEVPGRIQVVRARAARRLARLWRRRERRRVVPAARWQRVDDRQGRHHPGPARGGDHGAHGRIRPSCTRI